MGTRFFALLLALVPALAPAQGYPARPVRMIIPFAPGGASDFVGRIIQPKMSELLGQQLVIENRGGAAGNIGLEAAAKSDPDGYTMLMGTSSLATSRLLYHSLPYAISDLAAVTLVCTFPLLMVAPNSSPAKSVAAFIAFAREKRGKVTEFKEIRGYIVLRRPNMLRMIGLYPIVRNKAFDIVSDGQQFKLSIPATNKFFVGHNDVIEGSESPLDTLRPQAIYDALLLQGVNPENEVAVLEDSTEMVVDKQTHKLVYQPNYVLDVVRKTNKGWTLARKVVFDRTNLVPHRQVIFDEHGKPVTDASYQVFKDYDGVQFPGYIDIKRPQEEYDIRLFMVKLAINQTINEDQFGLDQPAGSILVNLDERQKTISAKDANGPTPPAAAAVDPPASTSSPH